MKKHIAPGTVRNLITQAIISLLLVLPFVILELINRRSLEGGFPFALFGFMWILTFLFLLILVPVVQSLRATNSAKRLSLLPKVVLMIVIAWVWVSLVVDQMPCFLGVPNCD